ncbi:helicase HerA domain-containing protein [Maridesulfovibrio sp.]|uniref:helicase HerA domain-containing protein n=1 Tax=Maridesulfovibrio sp. TaxID=2795000 RepID=UPI0029C9D475|nr:DUF87 domain-containing protein [Maridesulfovibrio sp.]
MTEQIESENIVRQFAEIDQVVFKQYLTQLNEFPIAHKVSSIEEMSKNIRMNKISRIVYDREENNLEKLSSVFSSMAKQGANIFLLIQSDGSQADIYLGTQLDAFAMGHLAIETFERSLDANFPGIEMEKLAGDEVRTILKKLTSEDTQYISSVSGIPSLKNSESDTFVQGIEKLVNGMRGKAFSAIMLATPVSRTELEHVEAGYQELYSALSILETQQVTCSTNQSRTLGITIGESLSSALSKTVSTSRSTSTGTTNTETEGTNSSNNKTHTQTISVPGTAIGAATGFAVGGPLGAIVGGIGGMFFGPSVSASRSSGTTEGTSHSRSHGTTSTETQSQTESEGTTETTSTNKSESDSISLQQGKSVQLTFKNKRVSDVLQLIEEQLIRIRECKNQGMWNYGVYFLDALKSTTQIGADLLVGIMSGETTGIERNATLVWSRDNMKDTFDCICKSLACFSHPVFDTSSRYSFPSGTATALVSTNELAVGMNLPQKSLPGIPVFESVEFGRSISSYGAQTDNQIDIGEIQHLGKNCHEHRVKLDVDSLSSHMFITGSTGAGKSNAIYSILHSLWKQKGIPFLVIEPAKGEYKNIFGGYKRMSVFGTNPSEMPILKLNPFSFPKGIHITEHIDRLVEILNAVWPMYAAMPAILKAAVEKAYEVIGWNLSTSQNVHGNIFPDFHDLLNVLPEIITDSAYSAEMKGNYTGALVTRVRSLTNGYYRSIFQKNELDTTTLFDSPCIVDLSRIGSSETKALLMGILFLKLQEHRMASATASNVSLKHVTVMEEAHNLMRRTSFDQNSEGSNLQGKAVEMIANAIAEMRTYGEGFIIADQAPGLLDQAVIRNTNTKVVLRLPDWEDRALVGRSANLNDKQIEELAILRKGCAAVYQNDWQEAVLCQYERFQENKIKAFEKDEDACSAFQEINDVRKHYRTKLLQLYLNHDDLDANEKTPDWMGEAHHYFPSQVSKIKNKEKMTSHDFKQLLEFTTLLDKVYDTQSSKQWFKGLLAEISAQIEIESVDDNFSNQLITNVLDTLVEIRPDQEMIWANEKSNHEEWAKELI